MEFLKEEFDESASQYVLTYSTSEEEKEAIEAYCKENNTTIDELVNGLLRKAIDHPDEFAAWLNEMKAEKMPKGTPGKPVFKQGDIVGFYLQPAGSDKENFYVGSVEIIDAYGTFFNDSEPSYDILVEKFNGGETTLCKHIAESSIYKI